MLRRLTPSRRRFACLRFLFMCVVAAGGCFLLYSRLSIPAIKTLSSHTDTLSKHFTHEHTSSHHGKTKKHKRLRTDDGLVLDGATESPDHEVSTMGFDVGGQLRKDQLVFAEQLQELGISSIETEDQHISVDDPESQRLQYDMEYDGSDLDPGYDQRLMDDDHIPGLTDDTENGRSMDEHELKRLKYLPTEVRESLMEDELVAVARLAEEEAMEDAEEQEWAKLGDVEEAEEWKKEAQTDWDSDEEEIEEKAEKEEQNKFEEREKKKEKIKKKRQKKPRTKEEMEMTTIEPDEYTTIQATTPDTDADEEVMEEEEEEDELFSAPDARKITRLLSKVGLDGRNRRYRTALETYASKDKRIILTLSDSRYTMMVLNFYETNVLRLGLQHVLFLSLDGQLCAKLEALNIPCFIYARDEITPEDIRLGFRRIFNRKVYYRSRMILEAVAMGYTVFYSDVDVAFIRDPLTVMDEYCGNNCHVAFQQRTERIRRLSWGVNYVKPSVNALYLYYQLTKKTFNNTVAMPDKFINRLEREGKLNLVRLPLKKFRSGIDYFENVKFAWDHRCNGCVTVHNDETFSKEAKMYRFKELLYWHLNVDRYYSDKKRKYLMYDNPYLFHNGTETLIMELKALRNALALGQILRRIVILPRFHCFTPVPQYVAESTEEIEEEEEEPPQDDSRWCNLHDVLRVEIFHRWFMGRYREHSFLSHPKVPRVIRKNASETFYIGHKMPEDIDEDGEVHEAQNITLVKPKSSLYGAQSEEVRILFEKNPSTVLRFHSLYYSFSHFLSDEIARSFNRRIKLGFDFRRRVHYTAKKLKVKRPEQPAPRNYAEHPPRPPVSLQHGGQQLQRAPAADVPHSSSYVGAAPPGHREDMFLSSDQQSHHSEQSKNKHGSTSDMFFSPDDQQPAEHESKNKHGSATDMFFSPDDQQPAEHESKNKHGSATDMFLSPVDTKHTHHDAHSTSGDHKMKEEQEAGMGSEYLEDDPVDDRLDFGLDDSGLMGAFKR